MDSDDRNECKLIIAEKDEQSYSPVSLDNGDWKISRKLVSPVRNALLDWKQGERNQPETRAPPAQGEPRKTKVPAQRKPVISPKSIYMNDHELQKFHSSLTFQKHPNDNNCDDSVDASIPNAEDWNTNDVYQYFSSYFPDEAHVFKEKVSVYMLVIW